MQLYVCVDRNVQCSCTRRKSQFAWCVQQVIKPELFVVTIAYFHTLLFPRADSTAFGSVLRRMHENFNRLYKRKAMVHHYTEFMDVSLYKILRLPHLLFFIFKYCFFI